jgi:hypothetical protein
VLPSETHWDGPRRLRIVAPGRIEWQFDLSPTLATRAMNLMGSLMPDTLWKSPTVLAAMAPVAGVALGAGKLRLTGRTPNGQRFIATLFRLDSAQRRPPSTGATLVRLRLCGSSPGWAIFGYRALGCSPSGVLFDAFDPEIHSAATSRTESALPESSTKFAAA